MAKKIPEHLGMTAREWKAYKRQQLRDVISAMNDLGFGTAYTPDHGEWSKAMEQLKALHEKMRPANWK